MNTDRVRRLANGVWLLDAPSIINVRRLDAGCVPMVAEMMRNGFLLDQGHFHKLSAQVGGKLSTITAEIRDMVGNPKFNPGSHQQVGELLFKELALALPGGNRNLTASGAPSTDEDVLSLMLNEHPVVSMILDYRGLAKLKGTYVDKLPLMVGPDGRLRCQIRLTNARTGRMSSDDPNLQNIPVRDELGNQVRYGFIAGGDNSLVSFDLSQIEMVLAAHESQDKAMMEIFWRGLDMHVRTACGIFRNQDGGELLYDAVMAMIQAGKRGELTATQSAWLAWFLKNCRVPSKTIGFGILYGQTAEGMQQNVVSNGGPLLTVGKCAEYILAWYALYSGAARWMQEQQRRVRQYGMTWDIFGRPRLIPEVRSVHRGTVNAGLRQCVNTPIQSGAGGILKVAMDLMMPIVRQFQSYHGEVCMPVMPVHDEVIFEVSPGIKDEFMGLGKIVMETAVPLTVPVHSSATSAHSWGELK